MISYRTKRSHARSRINRIFPRVVFLERKLGVSVFSSLFMWGGTSLVGSDLEWQSQRKNYFKNGFSFAGSHLPCRKFIWLGDLLFSFLYRSGIILFSSDLFLFTFFRSLIGNPSFPFFSFLPFRSLIGNWGFSIRYSFSLEEILLSFSSGERMRILFIGQGSK